MKKLFIFMVAVMLAFAVGCQTGTNPDAGKDSDTSKESAAFTYEVTDEGTICITGVTDTSVSELVIPKKIDGKQVTEIGRYAFYECENLKSVELTNVVKIGKGAFSGCVNLESVSMPKVETIKDKAFLDCAKLTHVELPDDVELAENAFEGCDSLPVQLPTPLPTATSTPTPTPTLTPTPTPTPTPTVIPTPTAVPVDIAQFKNAKVGETVVFGSYEQDNNTSNGKEEIEWIVLEKTDDKILVISKYALDCQPYNEEWDYVTWETCTLRKWLNNEFLNTAFTAEEQKLIPTVTVTAEDNPSYETDAGNDTNDKVFLLSIAEVENYFATNNARMCEPTAYAVAQGVYVDLDYDYSSLRSCFWWLRSPGGEQCLAAYVVLNGSVNYFGGGNVTYDDFAVRPALWINLNVDTADQNGTYENVPTPTPAATAGSTNDKQFKNVKVGDTVVFGSYEQDNNTSNGKEEIEWIVLEKTEDRMLVISKYALDCQQYNETYEDVTWETCTLRKWLNNKFLNTAFTNEEQKRIPTVTVTAGYNPYWDTDAGNDTKDKVFLLSIAEVENYFADYNARMCEPTAYAVAQGVWKSSSSGSCWWWLRSPGWDQNLAGGVNYGGYISRDGLSVGGSGSAVRPALWINLNP